MSREPIEITPVARTWRDISQPVRTRAMSKGGRWRYKVAVLKTTAALAVIGALGWGIVTVLAASKPGALSPAVPAAKLKRPVLTTNRVLTSEWLERTLALPKNTSLMQLNLPALRQRVLGDSQVLTAEINLQFPDTLLVRIEERVPVARTLYQDKTVLIAEDGVIFSGLGYGAADIETLPMLNDVAVETPAKDFARVAGMKAVSELLATARLEAPHLYRNWTDLSLARLAEDGEIEVHAKAAATPSMIVVFKAGEKTLAQLGRLNAIVEEFEKRRVRPDQEAHIDLSLGAQHVPVTVGPPRLAVDKTHGALPITTAANTSSPVITLPNFQPKAKREL